MTITIELGPEDIEKAIRHYLSNEMVISNKVVYTDIYQMKVTVMDKEKEPSDEEGGDPFTE